MRSSLGVNPLGSNLWRGGYSPLGGLRGLRLAGDWQLYLEVLTHSDGHVAWVAAPLNVHRRHGGSVTGALAGRRHLEEIARVQARARESLGLDAAAIARQEQYLAEVARDVLGDGVA